jgi:hypothetical protein
VQNPEIEILSSGAIGVVLLFAVVGSGQLHLFPACATLRR